ncbi:MAG: type III-A CRISPR-associated RAMP protein Csm5 [Tepidisphaeraceae bacterium]|jgi:CRISPR-associated protein Csm5
MKSAMPLAFQVSLIPLSPVHVGSGECIEPAEYDLIPQGENYFLTAFNLPRVFHDLSPSLRTEYDSLLRRGDWSGVRTWLRKAASLADQVLFRIQVQPEAADEIRKNLSNPNRLGEIHLFARDPAAGKPYLPGSSLKGAMRTAMVDALAQANDVDMQQLVQLAGDAGFQPHKTYLGANFEAAVLGNLTDNGRADLYHDPLRQLAISDMAMPDSATYIDRIQIVRPPGRQGQDTNPGGIVIYREVTWSVCDGENLRFQGQLRLSPHLADRDQMGFDQKTRNPNWLPHVMDVATLCRQCNAFYQPRLKEELSQFVVDKSLKDTLLDRAGACDDHRCLVRLGRHSHFECVTVGDPFRQPPRRGFGKTRSYVAGSLPLGWAHLEFHPGQ